MDAEQQELAFIVDGNKSKNGAGTLEDSFIGFAFSFSPLFSPLLSPFLSQPL